LFITNYVRSRGYPIGTSARVVDLLTRKKEQQRFEQLKRFFKLCHLERLDQRENSASLVKALNRVEALYVQPAADSQSRAWMCL